MKKRLLSGLLSLLMLLTMLPVSALAVNTKDLDLNDGSIVITAIGYRQGNNTVTPYTDGYLITQTGDSTSNTITIESGTIDLTISGINIQASSSAAITVEAGATLNLTLAGENTLAGAETYAGISVAAAFPNGTYSTEQPGKVVIEGEGSLNVTGGDADGNCGAGAGIGGDGYGDSNQNGGDFGVVQIAGGTVTATGGGSTYFTNGAGAGIGGGGLYDSNTGSNDLSWTYAGEIEISGGAITANGGAAYNGFCGAAGIGNGAFNSGKNTFGIDTETGVETLTIEITGGEVEATGAVSAAGIGGSANGCSGPITIGGNAQVIAVGQADAQWGGAGIGSGDNGYSGPITIQGNAEVQATGAGAAAGIGSGGNGGGGATKITIEGSANVTASSTYGAGIGGGWSSNYDPAHNCGEIILDSTGTIVAYGGHRSQAIGMGGSNDEYTPPASPSDNKLIVGQNTGAVWMFTSRTTTPAFFGQGLEQDYFTLDSNVKAVWYTLTDSSAFPAIGTASSSDGAANYQWKNEDNILSIASGSITLASYEYKTGYSLGNWAYFGKIAEPPSYTIETDKNALDFGTVQDGYTQPAAQAVIITNTGNQSVTVQLPVSTNYIVTAGTGFANGSATLAPGASATFTVQPKEGLAMGNYNETLSITGPNNASVTVNLTFSVTEKPEPPAPTTYIVRFDAGLHGSLSGQTSFSVEDGSTIGAVPTVTPERNYRFTGWLGSDGVTYTSAQVLALRITNDMTFTAQYRYTGGNHDDNDDSDNGGGGSSGGSTTTYYTLTYDSNGGTEYDDERYVRNRVVELDKEPTREGYVFTGWYADKELTDHITEIKMTSNKTVYAGWEESTVPDWLNGNDHFAYVTGYPDGTVKPQNDISRAEVATIFFRLLDPDIRDQYLTQISQFTDVSADAWYSTAVSTMAALGIINGRTSDTFVPDAPITRAEFAAICARFDDSDVQKENAFTDISGHWAEDEIERAAALSWIDGYPNGTFLPDNEITRAEAMTMINRVLQRLPEDVDDLLPDMNVWPDNQPQDWYYLAVQEATNSHDFDRKHDGVHETWTGMNADPDWSQYQ